MISAADPLNLAGILSAGARIPATHKNALILQNGRVLATLISGTVEYLTPVDTVAQWQMRMVLLRGRKTNHSASELFPGEKTAEAPT